MGIKSKYKNSTEMFYCVNKTGLVWSFPILWGGGFVGMVCFFINIFVEQKLFPYAFPFRGGESYVQHTKN